MTKSLRERFLSGSIKTTIAPLETSKQYFLTQDILKQKEPWEIVNLELHHLADHIRHMIEVRINDRNKIDETTDMERSSAKDGLLFVNMPAEQQLDYVNRKHDLLIGACSQISKTIPSKEARRYELLEAMRQTDQVIRQITHGVSYDIVPDPETERWNYITAEALPELSGFQALEDACASPDVDVNIKVSMTERGFVEVLIDLNKPYGGITVSPVLSKDRKTKRNKDQKQDEAIGKRRVLSMKRE